MLKPHCGFNPRPASGAKSMVSVSHIDSATVSIRAPRAGRNRCSVRIKNVIAVSIRAPRAGRNSWICHRLPSSLSFQSAPRERGEMRRGRVATAEQFRFQSAPRERGEIIQVPLLLSAWSSFNPRPASGAKSDLTALIPATFVFQSAPRERGENINAVNQSPDLVVSIRAPRAGRNC